MAIAKKKDGKWLTSGGKVSNFSLKETACKCGCGANEMQQEIIDIAQAIREAVGKPLTVTSGFRCEAHNSNEGGSKSSYHTRGMAIDLVCPSLSSKELFDIANRVDGVMGLIWYAGQRNIHVDTRRVKIRLEKTREGFYVPA